LQVPLPGPNAAAHLWVWNDSLAARAHDSVMDGSMKFQGRQCRLCQLCHCWEAQSHAPRSMQHDGSIALCL
jgi:hypothetical protein